ncbi:major facilitator superfamily MFS_1 [Halalkaliarchaeum desulfuricum]|uniref:Major facilitator superfamily MFS_1 n=1 Tax=Halalkaliarchaeum desulfuricum TaxID=2055893 RepID=A0A343TMH4_9EURY|nr:MFS transporter [Halalkaliarchaeum desulfuricum]AUX10296.1 major facilitator superfamily MFS_1 [Halalkaliarchaeum desulfuricum]
MSKGWLYAWGLGSIALGGASLIVPLYIVALGGTAFTLGILAAVAAFVGVPAALVFGRLADRTGKRRLFVLGALGLVTAMLLLMPTVGSIAVVVAANGVIWFAFAAATPVLTLFAVADAPPASWSTRIATLNKYQGIGWAFGLLLGAVWTGTAERLLSPGWVFDGFFLLTGLCAGIGLIVGARTFPADPGTRRETGEGRTEDDPRITGARVRRALRRSNRYSVRTVTFPFTPMRTDFRGLRFDRLVERFTTELALYFSAVFVFFAGFSGFFAPLPAFLADTGFTSGEIFVLYLVSGVGSALAFGTAGRLAARFDAGALQATGLVVRGAAIPAVALVGLAFGASPVSLGTTAAVFAVIGLTWAVIAVTGGTLVTRLAPMTVRGEALGVYAALGALAGGFGSIVGGYLAAIDYLLAFGIAGVLVVLGAVIVLAIRRRAGYLTPR